MSPGAVIVHSRENSRNAIRSILMVNPCPAGGSDGAEVGDAVNVRGGSSSSGVKVKYRASPMETTATAVIVTGKPILLRPDPGGVGEPAAPSGPDGACPAACSAGTAAYGGRSGEFGAFPAAYGRVAGSAAPAASGRPSAGRCAASPETGRSPVACPAAF